MTITASSQENYAAIEGVLTSIDGSGKFFEDFESAFKDETIIDQLVVVLKSKEKPCKDLNHQRYVVNIPSSLKITNMEITKTFDSVVKSPCQPRNPSYGLKLVCTSDVEDSVVILVYGGFNDPCIFVNTYAIG